MKTVWRAIWVEIGTNLDRDEIADTKEELRLKIYGGAYGPHQNSILVWQEEREENNSTEV